MSREDYWHWLAVQCVDKPRIHPDELKTKTTPGVAPLIVKADLEHPTTSDTGGETGDDNHQTITTKTIAK